MASGASGDPGALRSPSQVLGSHAKDRKDHQCDPECQHGPPDFSDEVLCVEAQPVSNRANHSVGVSVSKNIFTPLFFRKTNPKGALIYLIEKITLLRYY